MTDKTRDAFEAWLHKPLSNGKSLAGTLDTLQKAIAENTWLDCWQAATLAEQERCALVCEQHMQMYNDALNEPKLSGIELSTLASMKLASRCCAAVIRQGGAS